MKWIDSTTLENWSPTRDCQEHLPLVVRRLIRATAKDISDIIFPAGDSVIYPGWDGILNVSQNTEYIPEGISVWEIGTNKDIIKKANEDYQKRKENPLGIDPPETTFIFVTPRRWINKDNWANEKKAEKFWKDVKVYDAVKLDEWLEQAPAVSAWLAQYLGIYPEGIVALEDWWSDWSMITNPSLTSSLVIAGRDNEVESVRKWLNSSPSSIAVQAASNDEALAFLAAVINILPESDQEFHFSRSLVVENYKSFRHLNITIRNMLLLVPRFEEIEYATLAVQRGHYVYIPLAPDNKVTAKKIILPHLSKDAFVSALEEMGLSKEDAQKYSRDTGRSLTVLRRQLSNIKNQPEWAKSNFDRDIIPVLLAGRWKESKEADKEIISQLANEPYESFSKKLTTWLHKTDSPVLKIGDWWRLLSPIDAWFALGPLLAEADLQQFRDIILKVLRTINPALDLEPEKRWMSSAYGKVSPYSEILRDGIAHTLILIAVFGDDARIPVSLTAQTWVNNVVGDLLKDADWKLWHSLGDVLPLIAEASPSSFMDAVESSLSQDNPSIMGMFSETEDSMTSSSSHPSLLWALECLAWSPEFLGRVTLILGKLARLDPGGKLSNRPANSLRFIFLLWLPQTFASLEKRLEAIDTLMERESEVGWELLMALMPRNHDSCFPTHKPCWRQFSEKTENTITIAERWESIRAITERVLIHVNDDGQRWVKILENFPALPNGERQRIVEKISSCADKISNGRSEIWNKLREILSLHRSFPDSDWALPEEELREIEKIYFLFEPKDTIERFLWLFDEQYPDLPEGEKKDHKRAEQKVTRCRSEAIKVIKNEHGLEGLINLAKHTKNSWLIGIAVAEADIVSSEEEQRLLSLLDEEDKNKVSFVQGYIFNRSLKQGDEWITTIAEMVHLQQWTIAKTVNLFISFPMKRIIWDLLESFNEEIREGYWRQCAVRPFDLSVEDKMYILKQLLHVKRHFTALDIAGLFLEDIPAKLVAELLEKAATEKSDEDYRVQPYDVERLFEVLDKSGDIKEEEIAQLEWMYLPILAGVSSGRPPKMLHSKLSSNPRFFAEVIKYTYKPYKEDKKDDNETLRQELIEQRAHFAWDLLHSWETVPGNDENGQINYERLKIWVHESRELCEESDRKEVGDIHIGQVLAHAISEQEGVWPPEAVCKIIDEIQIDKLDNGFSIGIYNKRGAIFKSPFEGGRKERELAEQFRRYAEKLATRYPRTSSILAKVAEEYENIAKREDKEAERWDLEY
jgi:hypothetical protein